MTKSLVINCSLNRRAKIKELLTTIGKYSGCTTVQFRDVHAGYEVEKDIDAVVLSGSKARIVNTIHRDMFKETIDLINRLHRPTLGICYGYQLICWSLGCEVASLAEPVIDRFEGVRVVEVDDIFAGFEENQIIPLAQSHYDFVRKGSLDLAGLILLADSQSCEVEAVKHRHDMFYGVQFHPERINIKGHTSLAGHKVLENFFKNVVKR